MANDQSCEIGGVRGIRKSKARGDKAVPTYELVNLSYGKNGLNLVVSCEQAVSSR